MRVGLLKAETKSDEPADVGEVVENILAARADIFIGPDNLFSGNYKTEEALFLINHIKTRTSHLPTIILPGTVKLHKKQPVCPIIYKGKLVDVHEKYNLKKQIYIVGGVRIGVTICSEIWTNNPIVQGEVDIHALVTCGIYPSENHLSAFAENLRSKNGGIIAWADGLDGWAKAYLRRENSFSPLTLIGKEKNSVIYYHEFR